MAAFVAAIVNRGQSPVHKGDKKEGSLGLPSLYGRNLESWVI